jgi:hypothetical protein
MAASKKAATLEAPWHFHYWLWIQLIIVTNDLSYILFRPLTLEGGSLRWMVPLHAMYEKIDMVYGTYNAFGIGQSMMNVLENFVYLYALLQYRAGRKNKAYFLWFSVLLCTFAKTFLYALVEVGDAGRGVSHNDWFTIVFLYIIPNNVWTVVPGYYVFFVFGPAILALLPDVHQSKSTKSAALEADVSSDTPVTRSRSRSARARSARK